MIDENQCEGDGFKIINCQPFILKPNESFVLEMKYIPNVASNLIQKTLVLIGKHQLFQYQISAELPFKMILNKSEFTIYKLKGWISLILVILIISLLIQFQNQFYHILQQKIKLASFNKIPKKEAAQKFYFFWKKNNSQRFLQPLQLLQQQQQQKQKKKVAIANKQTESVNFNENDFQKVVKQKKNSNIILNSELITQNEQIQPLQIPKERISIKKKEQKVEKSKKLERHLIGKARLHPWYDDEVPSCVNNDEIKPEHKTMPLSQKIPQEQKIKHHRQPLTTIIYKPKPMKKQVKRRPIKWTYEYTPKGKQVQPFQDDIGCKFDNIFTEASKQEQSDQQCQSNIEETYQNFKHFQSECEFETPRMSYQEKLQKKLDQDFSELFEPPNKEEGSKFQYLFDQQQKKSFVDQQKKKSLFEIPSYENSSNQEDSQDDQLLFSNTNFHSYFQSPPQFTPSIWPNVEINQLFLHEQQVQQDSEFYPYITNDFSEVTSKNNKLVLSDAIDVQFKDQNSLFSEQDIIIKPPPGFVKK